MKVQVQYLASFIIPKELPHRGPREDENSDDWAEFCNDSVGINKECTILWLYSNHGSTGFSAWIDAGDHYVIPAETKAEYEGAYSAFNAVAGIKFPAFECWSIESTLGNFDCLGDYCKARSILLPVRSKLSMEFLHGHRDGGCEARNIRLDNLEAGIALGIAGNIPASAIKAFEVLSKKKEELDVEMLWPVMRDLATAKHGDRKEALDAAVTLSNFLCGTSLTCEELEARDAERNDRMLEMWEKR